MITPQPPSVPSLIERLKKVIHGAEYIDADYVDCIPAVLFRDCLTVLQQQQEALIEQRCIGHGEGQEHTIADVNAGRIDDLIRPRLQAAEAALWTCQQSEADYDDIP